MEFPATARWESDPKRLSNRNYAKFRTIKRLTGLFATRWDLILLLVFSVYLHPHLIIDGKRLMKLARSRDMIIHLKLCKRSLNF